jgi:predicted AlkP superfamily phosphohydrolase/phosphomutase
MQARPWEVLMAVFVATDRVQHYYWPGQNGVVEDASWIPIRHLFQRIDSFLADALALVDESTTLLVVSDHGFGHPRPATDCLNPLFAQLGLLRYRRGAGRLSGRLLTHLLLQGRRIIPDRLQAPLARAVPGLRLRAIGAHTVSSIQWSQTQVSASPSGNYVSINVEGRQPEGTVPRHDYHHLRERVREILLNLTDPATGRRVVHAVHRREDVYQGPYTDQAGDLLVEWEDDLVADRLRYSAAGAPVIVGPAKTQGSRERASGHHRSKGVLIAYGPHIRRGETVHDACLYDIAPTILYLQGQPIPQDMDGNVLDALFTPQHLRDHPVQRA